MVSNNVYHIDFDLDLLEIEIEKQTLEPLFTQILPVDELFISRIRLHRIVDDLTDYHGQVLEFVRIKIGLKHAAIPIYYALADILPTHLFGRRKSITNSRQLLQQNVGDVAFKFVHTKSYRRHLPPFVATSTLPDLMRLVDVLDPVENPIVCEMLDDYLILLSPSSDESTPTALCTLYKRHIICAETGQICFYCPKIDACDIVKMCPQTAISSEMFCKKLDRIIDDVIKQFINKNDRRLIERKRMSMAKICLAEYFCNFQKLQCSQKNVSVKIHKSNKAIDAIQDSLHVRRRQLEHVKSVLYEKINGLNEYRSALNELQVRLCYLNI